MFRSKLRKRFYVHDSKIILNSSDFALGKIFLKIFREISRRRKRKLTKKKFKY